MYIRRKAYSVAYDENGKERLFSTTEIMSEKLYSEKKENDEKNKAEKIGKKAMIAGTAGTVGSVVVPAAAIATRPGKEGLKAWPGALKAAAKKDVGKKLNAKDRKKIDNFFNALEKDAEKAINQDRSKFMRRATKAVSKKVNKNVKIGLGVVGAGAGTYLYGKHKAKKSEDQKKNN